MISKRNVQAGAWIHKLRTGHPKRVLSLAGTWTSLVWPQNVPGVPHELDVTWTFKPNGKLITGTMTFMSWVKEYGLVENVLVGGFYGDNLLRFEYTNKKDQIYGWGEAFFEMGAHFDRMTGRLVGFSGHTGKHFTSEIQAIKGNAVDMKEFSISKPLTIFIGHGRNDAWKGLKDHLQDIHRYGVQTFESGPRAGMSITSVLQQLFDNASFGLFVMTGEDKIASGASGAKQHLRARQNVIHEIGLFQGKLGPRRAVVLLETGVEPLSNISGTVYISFKKGRLAEKYGDIVGTIRREFPKS